MVNTKIHSQAVTYACNHSILEDNTGDSPAGNQLSSKPTWDTVSKEGGWGEDGGGREQGEVGWEENERNMTKILYF